MLKALLARRLGAVGGVLSEIGGGRALPGLAALMVAASLAEILGVASIAPFVGFVSTGGTGTNPLLQSFLAVLPGASPVVALGLLSFAALLLSNVLQALTSYAILRLTWSGGERLSSRIFDRLLARPYEELTRSNSSEALSTLLQDVTSAIANVLIPILATLARVLAGLAVLALLVAVNWRIALLGALVAAGSYVLVFRLLAPLITRYGRRFYAERKAMYQLAAETMAAIPEVRVHAAERYFSERFAALSRSSAEADAKSQMMRQVPRYVIETVAFGGMILIVVALAATLPDARELWPLLALYAVAAWRLLPAAQQVFSNVTSIRHHWPALESVNRALGDLAEAPARQADARAASEAARAAPVPAASRAAPTSTTAGARALAVELSGVTFIYAGAASPVVERFSLAIEPGRILGITGRSGAGKSTLLGLCLGLLEPSAGTVRIGGRPPRDAIAAGDVAYVPQHPSFLDDSLLRNVAFGVPDRAIDAARAESALAAAGLAGLAASLPEGLATGIGERGGGLSGGQRQRLALARALYRNPGLVVLDEFTSALDAATERELLDTLPAILRGRTVLIVTHRPEVLELCDRTIAL